MNCSSAAIQPITKASQLGKAAGLGDLETVELVPPIEIGNRVWVDTNKNGIQDASENGLDGVSVKLTCGSDEATTTTANGGQFYFSSIPGSNATFMDAGENCVLSMDKTQTALQGYGLSPANADNQTDNVRCKRIFVTRMVILTGK